MFTGGTTWILTHGHLARTSELVKFASPAAFEVSAMETAAEVEEGGVLSGSVVAFGVNNPAESETWCVFPLDLSWYQFLVF